MATFTIPQLETILSQGEDSQHQFKRNFTNVDSLAAELVAFANAGGGHLIIGVEDNGSVTGLSREEIQRMFQAGGLVYAEENPVPDTTLQDIHRTRLAVYFENRYQQTLEESGLPLEQITKSLHIGNGQQLNLAGLLLFGRNPQQFRPAFIVKAVYIDGTSIASQHYRDSEDIEGCLLEQYEHAFSFITRNLHRLQVIASHATRQMPYRGLGSGIPRALESYAFIQLIDDREGNQFKVILQRPKQDTP